MSGSDPNPGSDEAIEQGCECPAIDNARGKGVMADGEHYGWWINSQCPLHGDSEYRATLDEMTSIAQESGEYGE